MLLFDFIQWAFKQSSILLWQRTIRISLFSGHILSINNTMNESAAYEFHVYSCFEFFKHSMNFVLNGRQLLLISDTFQNGNSVQYCMHFRFIENKHALINSVFSFQCNHGCNSIQIRVFLNDLSDSIQAKNTCSLTPLTRIYIVLVPD
mmetsp:Transcript_11530/g.20858  ORF Transcript_11530/g.20858 Transcript_11530/m.20858 type:complete len:148 (-) Transcript_11530:512-955(-)